MEVQYMKEKKGMDSKMIGVRLIITSRSEHESKVQTEQTDSIVTLQRSGFK